MFESKSQHVFKFRTSLKISTHTLMSYEEENKIMISDRFIIDVNQ